MQLISNSYYSNCLSLQNNVWFLIPPLSLFALSLSYCLPDGLADWLPAQPGRLIVTAAEKHHCRRFVLRGTQKREKETSPHGSRNLRPSTYIIHLLCKPSFSLASGNYTASGVHHYTHDQMWNTTRTAQWDTEIRENVFNGCYCGWASALCQFVRNNALL